MKTKPILFGGPMVRALLDGIKTQTRRAVKMKSHHQVEERDDGTLWPWMYDGERDADSWMACPYGQRGEQCADEPLLGNGGRELAGQASAHSVGHQQGLVQPAACGACAGCGASTKTVKSTF